MTISLVPNSLEHISSQELTRLSALWRAQASTGQVEAREIAQAFTNELVKRHESRRINHLKTPDFKNPSTWRNFLALKIKSLKKQIKGCNQADHQQPNP